MEYDIRIVIGLAKIYIGNGILVARICDEVLDPTGALLGDVRYAASELGKAASEALADRNR